MSTVRSDAFWWPIIHSWPLESGLVLASGAPHRVCIFFFYENCMFEKVCWNFSYHSQHLAINPQHGAYFFKNKYLWKNQLNSKASSKRPVTNCNNNCKRSCRIKINFKSTAATIAATGSSTCASASCAASSSLWLPFLGLLSVVCCWGGRISNHRYEINFKLKFLCYC